MPVFRAPNSIMNLSRIQPWNWFPYRLGYLSLFKEEDAYGPLQKDEALFIFSLVRVLRPKVILEFGFLWGNSTYNFLQAVDLDAKVFSFDIGEISKRIASKYFNKYPNFRFINKSQTDFEPADIDSLKADIVFIDAAHELSLNIETFKRIQPILAERGVVLIHDTGTWPKKHFQAIHHQVAHTKSNNWLNESEFEHQREEREFVNYLAHAYPDYVQVHFHSLNTIRHGITMLQKAGPLPIGEDPDRSRT